MIWTSVCMKIQKGGREQDRDQEDLLMLMLNMIIFWGLTFLFEIHFSFSYLIVTIQKCPKFNPNNMP